MDITKTYNEERYGKRVNKLPEDAMLIGERTGYIRKGEIYRSKTGIYHVHKVGGSHEGNWYSKGFGTHLVYRSISEMI